MYVCAYFGCPRILPYAEMRCMPGVRACACAYSRVIQAPAAQNFFRLTFRYSIDGAKKVARSGKGLEVWSI